MKKIVLAASGLLFCSALAFASQSLTLSSSHGLGSVLSTWSSSNSKDSVSVTGNGNALLTVQIVANKSFNIPAKPQDGINVICNGTTTHVDAGSGFQCVVTPGSKNNTVSWSDDDSSTNGASGSYSIG